MLNTSLWGAFLLVIYLIGSTGHGQIEAKAKSSADLPPWLPLWEDDLLGPSLPESDKSLAGGRITRIATPAIQVWPAQHARSTPTPSPAILICPGGGYGILAMQHEGSDIAHWLSQLGVTAVVLKYRVSDDDADGYQSPWPMIDAARAIATIRHHSAKWQILPDQIGILGFSAGGHLAAMSLTRPLDLSKLENHAPDQIDSTSTQLNFGLLIYPVISLSPPYGHAGSRRRLLGKNPTPGSIDAHSPIRFISPKTPPVFLVHSQDDPVSPLNSLDFAKAALAHKVPVTLHLFQTGGHGYGIKTQNKATDQWPIAAQTWLQQQNILPPPDQ